MTLVRIVKNWDWPDLFRQTPGGKGIWDNIQFTCDDIEECDYLVFLNNCMKTSVKAFCPPENVWVLMQEPHSPGFNHWVVERHEPFSKVFTHYMLEGDKYVSSHPAIPWFVNKAYDELICCDIPQKTRKISWVVGNANELPGHKKRLALLKQVQQSDIDVDLYGRAVNPIEDKWEGLARYEYSLSIENSSSPDYWTEKIADCFLSWTVPIYYGCTNLDKYFPENSFIRLKIDDPLSAIKQIKSIIETDNWNDRLPLLREARELILNKYQIFPHVSNLINLYGADTSKKQKIIIPPYVRSFRAYFCKKSQKIKKLIGHLNEN